MSGPPGIEEACEEIISLRHELKVAQESYTEVCTMQREALADLEVQCKFWRQAAEHAVTGWNNLEDKYEHAIDTIREVLEEEGTAIAVDTWRKLELIVDESASLEPTPFILEEADLGDGVKLRVVEDEKPL